MVMLAAFWATSVADTLANSCPTISNGSSYGSSRVPEILGNLQRNTSYYCPNQTTWLLKK